MNDITVREATSKFLHWVRACRAKGTADGYAHYLKRFCASPSDPRDVSRRPPVSAVESQTFGDRPLVSLTPAEVLSWRPTWHAVQAVQRLTSWARWDARLITLDPLEGMTRPPLGERQRVLSRKEEIHIRRASSRAFRDFLLAMRETIARPGEIRSVKWEQIRAGDNQPATRTDIAAGHAYFLFVRYKAKDRRSTRQSVRTIPISARLGALLLRLLRRPFAADRVIFRNERDRPWTINAVRLRMWRVRKKVGIEKDWTGENVVCYTMRHTEATRAVRKGMRDMRLAGIMGHATTRTLARYVHLSADDLIEAMTRLRSAEGDA